MTDDGRLEMENELDRALEDATPADVPHIQRAAGALANFRAAHQPRFLAKLKARKRKNKRAKASRRRNRK